MIPKPESTWDFQAQCRSNSDSTHCESIEYDEDRNMKIAGVTGRRRHARDAVYGKRRRGGNVSSWTRHRFTNVFGRLRPETT